MLESYWVNKKYNRVKSIKLFFRNCFDFKTNYISYLLIILFLGLYFIYPFIVGKITVETPLYIAILMIPLMIFGGGMEEPGWRGLLESELEKKFPFPLAAIITSGFWSIWHFPLFFIEGSSQANVNFIAFSVLLIGMSFAQAVLYNYSKKVSLSILLHCAFNALQISLVFKETIITKIYVATIMIISSLLIHTLLKKKYL